MSTALVPFGNNSLSGEENPLATQDVADYLLSGPWFWTSYKELVNAMCVCKTWYRSGSRLKVWLSLYVHHNGPLRPAQLLSNTFNDTKSVMRQCKLNKKYENCRRNEQTRREALEARSKYIAELSKGPSAVEFHRRFNKIHFSSLRTLTA